VSRNPGAFISILQVLGKAKGGRKSTGEKWDGGGKGNLLLPGTSSASQGRFKTELLGSPPRPVVAAEGAFAVDGIPQPLEIGDGRDY
jgi:hypothetical protein